MDEAVTTTSGPVAGRRRDGVREFLGIPYAADPVGPLRFALPRPPEPWDTPLPAGSPGPAAPQAPSRLESVMGRPGGTVAERGCLTVNVWAPEDGTDLPVLFWIHGGATVSGSGGWEWYRGARLAAENGIVVVTMNYRLGALGFLYPAELTDRLGPGNLGLHDVALALEWTAANVAAFGGAPDAITVGGQSAGAQLAGLLAATERTRPLVRRVLLQSSAPETQMPTADEATEAARQYFAALGADPADADAVRALEATEFVDAYRRMPPSGGLLMPLGITRTSEVPWPDLRTAFAEAVSPEVDLLIGVTSDEAHAFRYPRRADAAPWTRAADDLTETLFRAPAQRLAEDRAAIGHPAYGYEFAWRAGEIGAAHGIDLPFLFGTFDAWADAPMLGDADRAGLRPLAAAFGGAVAEFVRSGRPSHPALPLWPAGGSVLRVDTTSAVQDGWAWKPSI
ncbi:carboxylesterase/lipase family protein [Amycolatopsis jejuensis]|uniref:carboxylesterase/lipase family protein n=1 Tax=Amycolatopsis jejuensis TaxID=330084 RepID=UPI0006926122|nr:carboxylesterase family protein [Amycolatopsis jejuensis]